jgi:hypothetical protein
MKFWLRTSQRSENCFEGKIKNLVNSGNACYLLVQAILFSLLLSKTIIETIHRIIIASVLS